MTDPTADVGPDWLEHLTEELQLSGSIGQSFGCATLTIEHGAWVSTLRTLRDRGAFTYFDWLSAVDDGNGEFTIVCHVFDPAGHRRVLVRTHVQADSPISSLTPVYRGAAWHERETAEMFGVRFVGPPLKRLLLSDEFEGHPLRKDFVLTARASKPWPGAKEPGESSVGSPGRRKMQPPGVPDPAWGPRPLEPGDG